MLLMKTCIAAVCGKYHTLFLTEESDNSRLLVCHHRIRLSDYHDYQIILGCSCVTSARLVECPPKAKQIQ